jgi:hypothetical protein
MRDGKKGGLFKPTCWRTLAALQRIPADPGMGTLRSVTCNRAPGVTVSDNGASMVARYVLAMEVGSVWGNAVARRLGCMRQAAGQSYEITFAQDERRAGPANGCLGPT